MIVPESPNSISTVTLQDIDGSVGGLRGRRRGGQTSGRSVGLLVGWSVSGRSGGRVRGVIGSVGAVGGRWRRPPRSPVARRPGRAHPSPCHAGQAALTRCVRRAVGTAPVFAHIPGSDERGCAASHACHVWQRNQCRRGSDCAPVQVASPRHPGGHSGASVRRRNFAAAVGPRLEQPPRDQLVPGGYPGPPLHMHPVGGHKGAGRSGAGCRLSIALKSDAQACRLSLVPAGRIWSHSRTRWRISPETLAAGAGIGSRDDECPGKRCGFAARNHIGARSSAG